MTSQMQVGKTFIHKNLSRTIYEVKEITDNQIVLTKNDEDGSSRYVLVDVDDKGFVNNLIPTGVPIERGILNIRMRKITEEIRRTKTSIQRYSEHLEREIDVKNSIQRELDILDQTK